MLYLLLVLCQLLLVVKRVSIYSIPKSPKLYVVASIGAVPVVDLPNGLALYIGGLGVGTPLFR